MAKRKPFPMADIDLLPCGCIITTADRRILFANPYFCDNLGWDLPILANQKLDTVLHRASLLFCDSYVIPTALQQGRCTETLLYLLNRAGDRVPMVANVRCMPDNTMIWAFVEAANRNKLFHELETARHALAEQREQLEQMSRTDALTGVANRRELDTVLDRTFKESERSGVPVSILMIDIDKFKSINDTYGHDVGDLVLCTLAKTLRTVCRDTDTVARLGGDEFVCVLPNTEIGDAQILADRIQKVVSLSTIGLCSYTISIGVSGRTSQSSGRYNEVLKFADVALYEAKAASVRVRDSRMSRYPQ